MQHIALQLETEDGELIERSEVNFADIMSALLRQKNYKTDYPWLSTIDPYGETVFNLYQVPNVLRDMDTLKGSLSVEMVKDIEQAINLLNRIEHHVYIRFTGD